MPNKVKNMLLLNTVLCATLGILFLITPFTAAVFSFAILTIVLALSFYAKVVADNTYELSMQRSSFMKLVMYGFIAMMFAMANFITEKFNLPLAVFLFIMAVENGIMAFKAPKQR